MPYLTRRTLDTLLAEAQQHGADQTKRELEPVLDEHLRTIGRRNAELCAENTELHRRIAAMEREIERAQEAVARGRRWINNLITGDPDDPDDDYPETAGTSVSLVKRGPA